MDDEKCFDCHIVVPVEKWILVYAKDKESAVERILKGDWDETMDAWDVDVTITKDMITKIEEE